MARSSFATRRRNPNVATDWRITPLYAAIERDYGAIVQLLLAQGANTDFADDQGQTPLFKAADHCSESVVKLLVEHGVDINRRCY